MSDDIADTAEPVAQPTHRSRWRRFSPSMGWPAFWSEILIVFLGVVIALAANEAVQEWTWRSKVQEAEVRLKQDVDALFLWQAEIVVTQPCIDAQLAELARRVLASDNVLEPAPIHRSNAGTHFVVRMPHRSYVFGTWEALGADGTANHFPRDRQAAYDLTARSAELARDRGWEAQRLLGRLQVMRHAVALDPGVRATLLADISQLRLLSEAFSSNAGQQLDSITQAFGSPDAQRIDAFLYGGPQDADARNVSGTVAFCKAQGLPLADWRAEETR